MRTIWKSRTEVSFLNLPFVVADSIQHAATFGPESVPQILPELNIVRKLLQEPGKKAQSAFLCHLKWFGSYYQEAIQQFCFPGCQLPENRCEWLSGPAKESLVVCQLQWLKLPKMHTACPALLIRTTISGQQFTWLTKENYTGSNRIVGWGWTLKKEKCHWK